MNLYLISDGSYADTMACVKPENLSKCIVISAEDATDNNIREAARMFADETGIDFCEVCINKLSGALSITV